MNNQIYKEKFGKYTRKIEKYVNKSTNRARSIINRSIYQSIHNLINPSKNQFMHKNIIMKT